MVFTIRFDMRAPSSGAATNALYAAAIGSGLRTANGLYRVFTTDGAVAYMRGGHALPLAPLCGGVPPEVAWPYLERAAEAAARTC